MAGFDGPAKGSISYATVGSLVRQNRKKFEDLIRHKDTVFMITFCSYNSKKSFFNLKLGKKGRYTDKYEFSLELRSKESVSSC